MKLSDKMHVQHEQAPASYPRNRKRDEGRGSGDKMREREREGTEKEEG